MDYICPWRACDYIQDHPPLTMCWRDIYKVYILYTTVWLPTVPMQEGTNKKAWQSCVNFGPPAQNTPPPNPPSWPPTLMKRVSICSEFKQLSACTAFMPNNAKPESYRAKTGLRTLLHWPPVQCTNPAKTFAKALFLLQSCNLCIMQCVNCKSGISCW